MSENHVHRHSSNAGQEDVVDQLAPDFGTRTLRGEYDKIVEEGAHYTNEPKAAKGWLRGFGALEGGTDVSMNLLGFLDPESDTAKSLIPVLTSWLRAWFQRTSQTRKDARAPSAGQAIIGVSPAQNQEENLSWLFAYIFDYLSLRHELLSPADLAGLCDALLWICQKTTEHGDIEEATKIIDTIVTRWSLPRDALEQTLVVMCKTRAALSRVLPSHLVDCINHLATGNLEEDTIKHLYAFITKAGTQASVDKDTIVLARGAVLFLGDIMHQIDKDGCYVIQFEALIQPLLLASKTSQLRLCTDILDLCDHMLLEDYMRPEILRLGFPTFMSVVRNCALAANFKVHQRSASAQKQDLLQNHDPSDQYLHNNEAASFRVKQSLALKWLEECFTIPQKHIVYDFFLDTPDDVDEAMLMLMLSYAHEQNVCGPMNPECEREINRLTETVVLNKQVPTNLRMKAIEVMSDSIPDDRTDTVSQITSKDQEQIGNVATKIVGIWLDLLSEEEDHEVIWRLMRSLEEAFLRTQITTNLDQTIIMRLEAAILNPKQTWTHTQTPVVITHGLITMLRKGYASAPAKANSAFQAILKIAGLECHSQEARLEAMRFLFRLRCDKEGLVYLQTEPESEYIAAALCRTRDSVEAFSLTDVPDLRRQSGSSTSLVSSSKSKSTLWMYPETESVHNDTKFAYKAFAPGPETPLRKDFAAFDMGSWLWCITNCIQNDKGWETYSYMIVHAGAQLANTTLFSGSPGLLEIVVQLRKELCSKIGGGKVFKPPSETGLKESDVAICFFNVLTSLIPYATIRAGPIQKGFADELVRAFLAGVGGVWEGTSRGCIHSMSICCLELPESVASQYPAIVDKMSKNMSQVHLTMHILEFLSQVARLPDVHSNFRSEEIVMIFGICIQYLEKAREKQANNIISPPPRMGTPSARQSGISARRPPYRAEMLVDIGLSHYTSALAYHTMIFWFLSLKLDVRAKAVEWIIPRLVWKDARGEEMIDEQSMVFIDMMQRVAYSDLGETTPHPDFASDIDGRISSSSWVVAQSIVTIETAGHTGMTQITKRQASGTTYAMYKQYTAESPKHHVPTTTHIRPEDVDYSSTIEMLPPHVLLQMASTADPTSLRKQPILLPKAEWVTRALDGFDRIVTVDSHKIGIIYVGEGQSEEKEYLANNKGSDDYQRFLDGLGTWVSLTPPLRYNPQGLQQGIDGRGTYAWRDHVTELVYHIPTMMPTNLEDDPGCTQKKSHVGNCHVNIIYNRSGLPWQFDNFLSQLNYVNIVITPADRTPTADGDIAFYRVHVVTKPGFPRISPAGDPKIISSDQLPHFVRMIALNGDVFSQAWNVKDSDTEFPSTWRARLQAIQRLRERVKKEGKGSLAQQLDFSGWTLGDN